MPRPVGNRPREHLSTHWRREQKAKAILARQGYKVVPAYGDICHLVAIGPEDVRIILIQTVRSVESVDLEKLKCADNVSREIWTWRTLARDPDIEFL